MHMHEHAHAESSKVPYSSVNLYAIVYIINIGQPPLHYAHSNLAARMYAMYNFTFHRVLVSRL